MGGVSLAFTDYFDLVNAVEIIPFHCKILENNIKVYNVENKVKVFCDDYIDAVNKVVKTYARFNSTPKYLVYN